MNQTMWKFRESFSEEEYDEQCEMRITRVKVETENGAKVMGKPVGKYLTLEAPNLAGPG